MQAHHFPNNDNARLNFEDFDLRIGNDYYINISGALVSRSSRMMIGLGIKINHVQYLAEQNEVDYILNLYKNNIYIYKINTYSNFKK